MSEREQAHSAGRVYTASHKEQPGAGSCTFVNLFTPWSSEVNEPGFSDRSLLCAEIFDVVLFPFVIL